jgi:hypothetical protein
VTEPPISGPEIPVTHETCRIRPRLTRRDGYTEAVPVEYRKDPRLVWEGLSRVAAWARPHGTEPWAYAALTYLTMCDVLPDKPHHATYSHPRWRTCWVVYDPELIRPTRTIYPSDYWRQQLSNALDEFAATLDQTHGRAAAR